jgi:hypothetical protein
MKHLLPFLSALTVHVAMLATVANAQNTAVLEEHYPLPLQAENYQSID